jgi:hypothetical protein
MEEMDFIECMAYMDSVDVLIHEKKAKEMVAQVKTEDALAYCLAMGFRMGCRTYKKKVEEEK